MKFHVNFQIHCILYSENFDNMLNNKILLFFIYEKFMIRMMNLLIFPIDMWISNFIYTQASAMVFFSSTEFLLKVPLVGAGRAASVRRCVLQILCRPLVVVRSGFICSHEKGCRTLWRVRSTIDWRRSRAVKAAASVIRQSVVLTVMKDFLTAPANTISWAIISQKICRVLSVRVIWCETAVRAVF